MTTIPESMYQDYQRRLNNFPRLLMREDEGVEMCRSLGRDDAVRVLDPTLLLKREAYDEMIVTSETCADADRLSKEDYVLVYSLNQSRVIFDEAYKLARKNNCKLVILKRSICPPNISRYKNAEELYEVSTAGFLSLIKNAKCVVTNSYHALIFSIVFNSNFNLYLDNADEENSRLLSLVRMLKLEDRIYWQTGHLTRQIIDIDYSDANILLDEQREFSIGKLKEALEEKLA